MKTGKTRKDAKSAQGKGRLAGSHWGDVLLRLFSNKIAVISLAVFLIICLACIFAPYLTKWDYTLIDASRVREGPSAVHILGTDNLGRDVFSRLLYGGRVTLRIALTSTVLATLFGGTIGLIAGYFGGKTDLIISPVLDTLASIPVILLALISEVAMGWGKGHFMYAMAVAAVPQFARLARATVINIIECEYIESARALGVGHFKMITRHVLHNIAPTMIVRFAGGMAEALLTCTVMGYLQIGITPPTPEWGVIVHTAKGAMRTTPHAMIIPCAVIAVCVISINLFSDGLRDALDPRE